jgi:pimeloyl-ACP methyl ester carboxylesterase
MLKLLADKQESGPAAVVDEMLPKLLGQGTQARDPEIAARVRELALSNPPEAIAGAIRALMTRPDSTPLLRTIHCPTLIVVGAEDALTPPSFSEEMRQSVAGSELVILPGAGHLSSLEQPVVFNAALAAFLTHRV